jgi:2-C-methyl-D-erythritol 2,4-cyclodiphosphate synthase
MSDAHVSGRAGIGYDIHRLVPGRPLFLGSIEIPHDRGLAGHSDGDVLCHAIADALLGAGGLGEIGVLFPDGDPGYSGISGADILREVTERVAAAGLRIGHVDAIVIAETPRLASHRNDMRVAIAIALAVEPERVSIKIKSNEGLDAIGRGEAIAAQAVAWVQSA